MKTSTFAVYGEKLGEALDNEMTAVNAARSALAAAKDAEEARKELPLGHADRARPRDRRSKCWRWSVSFVVFVLANALVAD